MITKFETIVLFAIALHENNPHNGGEPDCADDVSTWCWADDFTGGVMTVDQVKGVLSSLVKKGFIVIQDYDQDNLVSFTQAGFDCYDIIRANRRNIEAEAAPHAKPIDYKGSSHGLTWADCGSGAVGNFRRDYAEADRAKQEADALAAARDELKAAQDWCNTPTDAERRDAAAWAHACLVGTMRDALATHGHAGVMRALADAIDANLAEVTNG